MKISGQGPVNPLKAYYAGQQFKDKQEVSLKNGDKLELSETAQKIRDLSRAAGDLPEIRESMVAEIKKQVEQRTYQTTPEQLAKSLVAAMRIEK